MGAIRRILDSFYLARGNHTGTQSADTITDGTTNKAFLASERTKLAGVATGATANSSDATLLNRANHTGTQAQSTIVNLVTDLGAKAPLDKPVFTSRVQVGSVPTDTTRSYDNWNATGSAVSVIKAAKPSLTTTTASPPEPALVLARNGWQGVTFPNFVELKVGRYDNYDFTTAAAHTVFVMALTHGNDDQAGVDVLALYSDGTIGQPATRTIASSTSPGIKGQYCWDANYEYRCVATNSWQRIPRPTTSW